MKKVLFALAILPLLAFVSCSSDDDEKVKTPEIEFDYNIELLYGQWRATSVEGVTEDPIDLTTVGEDGEPIFDPTYITFEKDGSYSSVGLIGEATGEYTAKGKTIVAATGKDKGNKMSFEMTSLNAETSKVEINAKTLVIPGLPNLPELLPEGVENVTVVLTKQTKAEEK